MLIADRYCRHRRVDARSARRAWLGCTSSSLLQEHLYKTDSYKHRIFFEFHVLNFLNGKSACGSRNSIKAIHALHTLRCAPNCARPVHSSDSARPSHPPTLPWMHFTINMKVCVIWLHTSIFSSFSLIARILQSVQKPLSARCMLAPQCSFPVS